MKYAKPGLRIFLGLIYFVFGLNGFLHFLPQPPMPEAAGQFIGALFNSGYFFPVLKGTEVIGGLALLSGIYAPLALVVLAPVTLHIFLFHLFLAPQGMILQALMLVIHATLFWYHRETYSKVLEAKF